MYIVNGRLLLGQTMRSGEQTRRNIKTAALALFVERGVDAGGMRDIAKASGITEGAIYRHFKNKDSLIGQLISETAHRFAGELETLQAAEATTAAKLEALMQGFCRFFDTDLTAFRFLFLTEHRQLYSAVGDADDPIHIVERVVQAGIDAGEIAHPNAAEATAWMLGILLQSARFQIDGRLAGPLSARAEAMAGACLDALGL